jgi:hypothetical protein
MSSWGGGQDLDSCSPLGYSNLNSEELRQGIGLARKEASYTEPGTGRKEPVDITSPVANGGVRKEHEFQKSMMDKEAKVRGLPEAKG